VLILKYIPPRFEEKVGRITELGFSEQQAREAMSLFDGDVNRAVNFLVGS